MSERFATPQDAEDAFYDAIDDQDLAALMAVWEDSEEIACLLPMTPLVRGPGVREVWAQILDGHHPVEVQVQHLHWIETPELAVHYITERVTPAGQQSHSSPPMYATNLYRRGSDGWRLILHQNSPAPPPPGSQRDGPPTLG